jgi:cell division protein FtsN
MVRVGPVSDRDLAATITKQLASGGFTQTNVTNRTGYRVVSEPLPRSNADGVIATLAGRGFHSQLEPLAGDTVQLVFGIFSSQREAETLSQHIAAAGYDAWVREGVVYTLQLGPYPQSSVNTITGIIKSSAPGASVTVEPAP